MKINFCVLGLLGIAFGYCVLFYYEWYVTETLSDLAFIMVGFLSCFFITIGFILMERNVQKSCTKNKEDKSISKEIAKN